ncbi:hypothetical protein [uncultured Dokdonia sp.]|uniref:hypothetical protein n=1 Tax=uncultured Dokdonia sp. TaxID=575653 RepID=UPI0026301842|nr:hypothetical protein [uncultured Dokdonia sp.]
MFNNNPRIGQEILDVPMGDMIRQMAFAIAEGQMALDENSIEVAEMMGGLDTITDENGNTTFTDSRVFFGKERVSISDAVTIYNTTTDDSIKNQIFRPMYVEAATGGTHVFDTTDGNFDTAASSQTHIVNTDAHNANIFRYVRDEDTSSNPSTFSLDETKIELLASASPVLTEIFIPQRLSMLELGFTPTFYQFVDTIIEAKVAIKFTREGSSSVNIKRDSKTRSASIGFRRGQIRASRNITTTQVNANYSQKFSYSAEGSSLMRTKLVPIPPPAILEQRIQEQMEIARGEATNN